jgi:hypothetical protein
MYPARLKRSLVIAYPLAFNFLISNFIRLDKNGFAKIGV